MSLKEVKKHLPKCDLVNMSKAVTNAMCESMDGDLELRKKFMHLMNAINDVVDSYDNPGNLKKED